MTNVSKALLYYYDSTSNRYRPISDMEEVDAKKFIPKVEMYWYDKKDNAYKPFIVDGKMPVNDDVISTITSQIGETSIQLVAKQPLFEEQADYVQKIERYQSFQNMQFKRVNVNKAEVTLYGEGRHITYELYKNTDDMIVQSKVTTGTYVEQKSPIKKYISTDATLPTMTSAPTSTAHGYTTTTGAVLTMQVEVRKDDSEIEMRVYKTTTGGLWTFEIAGKTVDVSQYSATSVIADTVIFTGIPKGTHTLKGTFKGQDPANPVASPRGWVPRLDNSFVTVKSTMAKVDYTTTLTEPSNKEYAISFKPTNGGTTFNFMPYHGTATAFQVEAPKYYSGREIINFANMSDGDYLPIDSFNLTQHLYGRHPDTGTRNILEVWCKTGINKNGRVSFDGKVKVLEETNISNSYFIMGTARGDVFDTVVTSMNGKYYGDSSTYGTNIPMANERDWYKSYAFISTVNKDFVGAYRINDPKNTMRIGGTGKDTNPALMTYMQNRDATLKKVYSRLFNTAVVPVGTTFTFSGDCIYAFVPDIYNYF